MGEAATRGMLPPAYVHSQVRCQVGRGLRGVLAAATTHSQDGDDLHEIQGSLVELCNEYCGHTLEECGTIHVDSGTNGQDKAADLLGDTIPLLHALHHQR